METGYLSKSNTKVTVNLEDPINTLNRCSQKSFIKTTITRVKEKINREK